ncbi:hypothetical protein [Microbacterium sp. NPDC055683]
MKISQILENGASLFLSIAASVLGAAGLVLVITGLVKKPVTSSE